MTTAEIDAMAQAWQAEPCNKRAAALWRALQRPFGAIIRRRKYLVDEPDLWGLAGLAFTTSLRSWKPGSGYSFQSWVLLAARGRMNKACDTLRYQASLRGHVDVTAEPPETPIEVVMRNELRSGVSRILADMRKRMTPKEWHAVEGRLLRGLSYREMAEETGNSYQAIQQRAELVMPYVIRVLREWRVG